MNYCKNNIEISGDIFFLKDLFNLHMLWNSNFMESLVPKTKEYFYFENNFIATNGETLRANPTSEANFRFYGTKNDFYFNDIIKPKIKDAISFSVDTITPIFPFCQKLAEKYKVKVRIDYYEENDDFAGYKIFESNSCIEEKEYDGYLTGLFHLDIEEYKCELRSRFYNGDYDLPSFLEDFNSGEDGMTEILIEIYNS